MIILIISSSALGLLLSETSKQKIVVCSELISLCDLLLIDLEYKVTPITEFLNGIADNKSFSHLEFISESSLVERKNISSVLSRKENEEISGFLYSLGKSDVNSQKKVINGFKEYIKNSQETYKEKYKKDSKLYVTFGLFFGIVISLIWS